MAENDSVVSVRLRPEAKEALDALIGRYGMKQVEALGRILEWITRQPEVIQCDALGVLPQDLSKMHLYGILADQADDLVNDAEPPKGQQGGKGKRPRKTAGSS